MNAPKISHTVLLEKPESEELKRGIRRIKTGLGELFWENKTYSIEHRTKATAINPMAPPGNGSNISPTITPAKIAK